MPISIWTCTVYPEHWQKLAFLDPLPFFFVHVVIECPLANVNGGHLGDISVGNSKEANSEKSKVSAEVNIRIKVWILNYEYQI